MDSSGLRRGHAPGFHARSWTTGDGPCSIKAMVWNVILRNRRNGSRVCSTEPKASSTTVKLDSDCRLRKASQLHSPILLISASTIEQANNQVRAYDTLKHRSYTSPCILFSLFALAVGRIRYTRRTFFVTTESDATGVSAVSTQIQHRGVL